MAKESFICSNHFEQSDIAYDTSDTYLSKKKAADRPLLD